MPDCGPTSDCERVRERVLADHADDVTAVLECADAVAAEMGTPVADGRALADALERELADAGALAALPDVLRTGVDALGESLPAAPVAAPPYVVVTSRGPVVRGTVDSGRLVILVRAFAVEAGGDPGDSGPSTAGPEYGRATHGPAESLAVTVE